MGWNIAGNIRGPAGPAGANAADPWTTLKLASDVVHSTVAAVDLATLGFTPAANKTYEIRASLLVLAAAATTGVKLALAFPTGITGAYNIIIPVTATTTQDLYGSTSGVLTATTAGLTTLVKATLEATLIVATAGSGNVRPQLASEVAASAVTVKAGSWLQYRTIP